jgi:hypothetical protein
VESGKKKTRGLTLSSSDRNPVGSAGRQGELPFAFRLSPCLFEPAAFMRAELQFFSRGEFQFLR